MLTAVKRLKLARFVTMLLCAGTMVIAGPSATAQAAPTANVDATYGTAGLTTLAGDLSGSTVDATGRVVLVTSDRATGSATLTRLTAAGAKDPEFGAGGSVALPFAGAINANADGSISVVAVPESQEGITVHRVSSTGHSATTDTVLAGVPMEMVWNVAERANGDLIVYAYNQETSPPEHHVVAIGPDGALNPAWGSGGDLLVTDEGLYAVATAGDTVVMATWAGKVRRYTATGTADTGFGEVALPDDFGPRTVHVAGDAYYVGGRALGAAGRMAVVKVLADGSVDTTFGTAGLAVGATHPCTPSARRAFVTSGGVYLIGHHTDCGASRIYVERFTTAGVADTSFGIGGEIVVDQIGAETTDTPGGGGPQPDGRILVTFGTMSENTGVTRLLPVRTNPYVALTGTKLLSGYAIGARKSAMIAVRGRGGLPVTGVAAVALNVTVSRTTRAGGLLVYPTGDTLPTVYTHAHDAGQSAYQRLILPLGTDGRVTLLNKSGGTADLTVAVVGYYRTGGYLPVTPSRLVNSTVAAHRSMTVVISGSGGVPSGGMQAVTLNVTVRGTAAGDLKVYPAGGTVPTRTVAPHTAGHPGAAGVTVAPGDNGQVTFVNNSAKPATITADIAGYLPS
jgi:uncharacterized delta-60 repeat protein